MCPVPQRFIYTPNTKYLVQNSTETKDGMFDLINLFDWCKYCKYQKHVSKRLRNGQQKTQKKLQNSLKTPVLNISQVNRWISNSDFINTDELKLIICQRKQE